MTIHLVELVALTCIIKMVDTFSNGIRLNILRSGQYALSFSFFNIFALVARTANMFQAPMLGWLIDTSLKNGTDPLPDIRLVILASSGGVVLGSILMPTFLKLFSVAVKRMEIDGSVPVIVVQALHANNLKRIVKTATKPSRSMIHELRVRQIPKRLLLLNMIMYGISTIGVLASYYAVLMVPAGHRLATAASSGIINGVASVTLTLLVDPQSARITDQAISGKRPGEDVKALVVCLIGSELLGTILAQAFIVPAAMLIASFYR